MPITISEYRQKLAADNGGSDPYADLTDTEFAARLHERHYSDIPFEQFAKTVGVEGDFRPRGPTSRGATRSDLNSPVYSIDGGAVDNTRSAMERALAAVPEDPRVMGARQSMLDVNEEDQNFPSLADIGTAVKSSAARLPQSMLLKEYSELYEAKKKGAKTAAAKRALQSDPEFLELERLIDEQKAIGAEISADDQTLAQTNPGLLARSTLGAARSLTTQLPSMAAGIVTRNPALAMLPMYETTEADSYAKYIEQGLPHEQALRAATIDSVIEVGTEYMPAVKLFKPGSTAFNRLLEFMQHELPGESAATLGQTLNEHLQMLPGDVTAKDVLDGLKTGAGQLPETWLTTLMAGGVQSAALSSLDPGKAPEAPQYEPTDEELEQTAQRFSQAIPDEQLALPAPDVPADFTVDAEGRVSRPDEQKVPALGYEPEEPTGEFVGGPDGVRPLNQAEVNQAAYAREQRDQEQTDLGYKTRVPGWPQSETDRPVTMAQKREALKEKRESTRAAITPETKPRGVTIITDTSPWGEPMWGLAVDGKPTAYFMSEQLAKDEQMAIRAEVAKAQLTAPAIAAKANEAASSPTNDLPEPTPAQINAGNYKKGKLRVQGMDISVENPTGSIRRSKPDAPVQWERKMKDHYGYIRGTEDNTGEQVDVFVGPNVRVPKAFVIDQVIDGKFDEPKVMLGYKDEAAARKAYLRNYQPGWKGLGAITEMPIADFKTWVKSRKAKEPVAWTPPAPKPAKVETPKAADSVLSYAAKKKLGAASMGGFNFDELVSEGLDPAELRTAKGFGIKRPFTKGGASLDEWAEHLSEMGFPITDSDGKYDKNKLLELITDEIRTGRKVTSNASDREAELDAKYEENMRELAELNTSFDDAPEEMSDAELNALEAKLERLAMQMDEGASGDESDIPFPDAKASTKGDKFTEPMFSKRSSGGGTFDMFSNTAKPGSVSSAPSKPAAVQQDLFGSPKDVQNALEKVKAEKERRRNEGQQSLETGKPDDLFSQARNQIDVQDDSSSKKTASVQAKAKPEAQNDPDAFTVERDGKPVTFRRGDWVRSSEDTGKHTGEIIGISHANGEARISAGDGGVWYAFGQIYPAERPAEAKPDTIKTSEAIEKVNAKHGADLSYADQVMTVDKALDFHKRLMNGEVSLDEYKGTFEAIKKSLPQITAELEGKTKDELMEIHRDPYRGKSEKKDWHVRHAAEDLLSRFAVGETISFAMSSRSYLEDYRNAIQKIVDKATQATLDAYAATVAKRRAEHAEAMKGFEDPKTLEDFQNFIRYKGEKKLTGEQLERYDALKAEDSRAKLKAAKERREQERAKVSSAGRTVGAKVIETKHTKKGHDIFVVQMEERVERDVYNSLNASAKKLGGYYSSYRGGGAIPGFTFTERSNAEAFAALLQTGDTAAATEVAAQRREDFSDDKAQSTVERLRSMAERLEESAQEKLNADRKTNTARRASMANRAESQARSDLSMAKTMRNIADSIDSGKAVFLEGVRTKAQVEMLRRMLHDAQYDQIIAESTAEHGEFRYSDYEKRNGEKPTRESARYVRWPNFSIQRGDLASLARALIDTQGSKQLGTKLLSSADDVTAKYEAFVKDNLHQVTLRKQDGSPAVFPTKAAAEFARMRSPGYQKMVTVNIGKGKNYVVLSPREAQSRGLWTGDDNKTFNLNQEIAEEIIEKVEAHNAKAGWGQRISLPWTFPDAKEKRGRLKAMGIENPSMLREAMREYIALLDDGPKADPVKQKMRELAGKKNVGVDFFPTPAGEAENLVSKADIKPGMTVLEPSAGYGAIADAIRDAGVEPDVVEMSSTLREILELKGFDVVGTDFTAYSGKQYDRIVMNPPFSNGMDIDHVRHAYGLLKPGGRIVAIMGEGAFYRSDKKAQAFRDWADSLGAVDEELPAGTFLDPSLPSTTSANARVIVIDKPASGEEAPMTLRSPKQRPGSLNEKEVRAEVNRMLRDYKTRPRLTVVQSYEQLPQDVQWALKERGVIPGQVNAVAWNNGIYFIADMFATLDFVRETVIHETVIHFGLRSVVDRETHQAIIDGMIRDQPEAVERAGRWEFGPTIKDEDGYVTSGFDWNNKEHREIAAEEFLAYAAPKVLLKKDAKDVQKGVRAYVQKVLEAVRAFLRRVFGDRELKFTLPTSYGQKQVIKIMEDLETFLKQGVDIRAERYAALSDEEFALGERPTVQVDGERRPIHNSNGQELAQGIEAQRNFWQWFGDSKVVDTAGHPLVMHHGSNADFSQFEHDESDGIYFSSDPEYAGGYADVKTDVSGGAATVYPVYLAINRPLELSGEDQAKWEQYTQRGFDTKALQAQGYDGVVMRYEGGEVEAMAFHPSQIKSAIGNSGKFDRLNNSILANRTELQQRRIDKLQAEFESLFAKRRNAVVGTDAHRAIVDRQRALLREIDRLTAAAPMFSRPQSAAPFYSALTRVIENSKTTKAPAMQWMATIRNAGGVKTEEIEWSGVAEWLGSLGRPATKDEVLEFLRANQIQVKEVVKGGQNGSEAQRDADTATVELTALGYTPNANRQNVDLLLSDRAGNHWRYTEDGTWVNITEDGEGAVLPDTVRELGERLWQARQTLSGLEQLGGHDDVYEDDTRYSQYVTPGGENYREMLLTLPEGSTQAGLEKRRAVGAQYEDRIAAWDAETDGAQRAGDYRAHSAAYLAAMDLREERDRAMDAAYAIPESYNSSHWDEDNILAHVRFDERTDADGKRTLFIEEIQSDWHQAGRKKGYAKGPRYAVVGVSGGVILKEGGKEQAVYDTREEAQARAAQQDGWRIKAVAGKGVPDAPFKTTWHELAFKRMLRWAVDNGFDRIAWTTGDMQNQRYSLEDHIRSIEWQKITDRESWLDLIDHNGSSNRVVFDRMTGRTVEPSSGRIGIPTGTALSDLIGQELADVVASAPIGIRHGTELRMGGEGMRGFYDQILPATVNRMVKKWGAKVGTTNLAGSKSKDELAASVYGSGETYRNLPSELKRKIDEMFSDRELQVHAVDITPAMSESVAQGLPMFQRPGEDVTMELRDIPERSPKEKRGYAKLASRVIDTFNRKWGHKWGALGNLPEAEEYLKKRYRTLGGMKQVKDITHEIFNTLKKASEEDATAIYNYLTTAGASGDAIVDEQMRSMAMRVKEMIDAQGQALVQAGLLPEEAYEQYKDAYLPRIYLRHVLDLGQGSMGAGKRLSDLGYLKKRKDISQEVRETILMQITDPAFLAAFAVSKVQRDLTVMNFLEQISRNAKWTPPVMLIDWDGRKVSPFWLQAEAKQLRRQADHIKNAIIAGKARAIADRADTLANAALEQLGAEDLSDFAQIPDTARYGALRGLWVRKQIHEDLVGAYNYVDTSNLTGVSGALERTFGQGGRLTAVNQAWKTSKVALNIPSHLRNMFGNAIMLHLSGVNAAMLPVRLGQAIASITSKDEAYKTAIKYGMSEATFANQELGRIRDEWLLLQKSKQPPMNKTLAMLGVMKNLVGDVYQFEEALFKLAKYHDEVAKGTDPATAMIEAHKWVFDYSLVPRWVRYLRNAPFGVPFLSYSYFALPRMAETAVRRPWKFLPYIVAAYAMQELIQSMFGVDDDDVEKLKKAFPEWMQNRGSMMLWPYKDDAGRWQTFDLGYIVPWGQLADVATQVPRGEIRQAAETLGVFSGPVPDVIAAIQTGIDPFTKKPIANPGDPVDLQVKGWLNYAWNMAAPGFLNESGALGTPWAPGKIPQAISGRVDPRSGEPKETQTQAWLRLFGLNVYPIDPEATRERNLTFMKMEIDEVRRRLRSKLKDKNLTETDRAEIHRIYDEEIKRRQQALRQYDIDSRIPEKLRREPSNLTSRIAPLIDGRNKEQAVQALRDAGHPALASLIEEMPAKPRPIVKEALAQMRA